MAAALLAVMASTSAWCLACFSVTSALGCTWEGLGLGLGLGLGQGLGLVALLLVGRPLLCRTPRLPLLSRILRRRLRLGFGLGFGLG